MKNFIKPDWNNSNLNISATLAEFLGAKNNNSTLPILKKELKKNYKNIVFICFHNYLMEASTKKKESVETIAATGLRRYAFYYYNPMSFVIYKSNVI